VCIISGVVYFIFQSEKSKPQGAGISIKARQGFHHEQEDSCASTRDYAVQDRGVVRRNDWKSIHPLAR
jgi:hypothetical protein